MFSSDPHDPVLDGGHHPYSQDRGQAEIRMIHHHSLPCLLCILDCHLPVLSSLRHLWMSPSLACPEHTVPQPPYGGECVVAALVALMVPVMMVWHLGKWEPSLQGVSKVEPAAHARMLLRTFADAEYS